MTEKDMTKLLALRADSEKGFTPICKPIYNAKGDNLLVIVEDDDDPEFFNCHRYFMVGDDWHLSVDLRGASYRDAYQWLAEKIGSVDTPT